MDLTSSRSKAKFETGEYVSGHEETKGIDVESVPFGEEVLLCDVFQQFGLALASGLPESRNSKVKVICTGIYFAAEPNRQLVASFFQSVLVCFHIFQHRLPFTSSHHQSHMLTTISDPT